MSVPVDLQLSVHIVWTKALQWLGVWRCRHPGYFSLKCNVLDLNVRLLLRAYNCHGNYENAGLPCNTASYCPPIDRSHCNMTSSHIINIIWLNPFRRSIARWSSGSSLTILTSSLSFFPPFSLRPQWMPTKFESYNKSTFGSNNTGEYSVLRLCIVPPCGQANTATLELNIPLYCPPSHVIIYISRAWSWLAKLFYVVAVQCVCTGIACIRTMFSFWTHFPFHSSF